MDEEMVRNRCEGLRLKWLEDASSGDSMIDLAVQVYRAANADGLEAAAKILQDEVDSHNKEHGEHQYCDDYSCHYIKAQADKIRQHAKEIGHE